MALRKKTPEDVLQFFITDIKIEGFYNHVKKSGMQNDIIKHFYKIIWRRA